MLRDLVEQNLYFTYYNSEDGTYDLEFKVKNKTILVRGVNTGDDELVDDWYWTDERIERAIKNADPEQIEIREAKYNELHN